MPASAPEAAPAAVPAPLTLAAALDFVYAQLDAGEGPILPQVERELAARAAQATADPAAAAKKLGVTKAALQKLLKL